MSEFEVLTVANDNRNGL